MYRNIAKPDHQIGRSVMLKNRRCVEEEQKNRRGKKRTKAVETKHISRG